jgi:hypothetical protein
MVTSTALHITFTFKRQNTSKKEVLVFGFNSLTQNTSKGLPPVKGPVNIKIGKTI